MDQNSIELEINQEDSSFQPLKRTNFFISFCYLILQVLIPAAVLFFLTSRDFSFTFKLPISLMIILSFALLSFTIIATFITYKCKLHQIDQFTYTIPFVAFIIGLYLTSYWLDYNYFLIRFIIAVVFALIGIFFTSIVLLIILRRKNKK